MKPKESQDDKKTIFDNYIKTLIKNYYSGSVNKFSHLVKIGNGIKNISPFPFLT